MKIYVITSGEYSDYGIVAVFTDFEKAKLFCAAHNLQERYSYDYYIETYDTDDYNIESNIKVYSAFKFRACHVKYSDDAEILIDSDILYSAKPISENIEFNWESYCFAKGTIPFEGNISEDQMRKIVYDKIAVAKAERNLLI